MELYIVRHGEAGQSMQPAGTADASRALTPEGRRETAWVGEALRALGCAPDAIGTSPLVRARQTAETLAEVLEFKKRLAVCEFLSPDSDARALLKWMRGLRAKSVMIVGHMPDMAALASTMLARDAQLNITFKKSGVCCISFEGTPEEGAGCLEWLLQPKQVRVLTGRKKG